MMELPVQISESVCITRVISGTGVPPGILHMVYLQHLKIDYEVQLSNLINKNVKLFM
jgi:hypothetical protein